MLGLKLNHVGERGYSMLDCFKTETQHRVWVAKQYTTKKKNNKELLLTNIIQFVLNN